MSNSLTQLLQRLWNYCNILRDDGLSYGDYVEQLTFLLFLKMAEEQAKPPYNKLFTVPGGLSIANFSGLRPWTSFVHPVVIHLRKLSQNHER